MQKKYIFFVQSDRGDTKEKEIEVCDIVILLRIKNIMTFLFIFSLFAILAVYLFFVTLGNWFVLYDSRNNEVEAVCWFELLQRCCYLTM